MNPANLTREEARKRSQSLSAHSYRVSVDLTGMGSDGQRLEQPEETFVSTTVVRFSSDGSDSWIDLIADAVLAAKLDGQALDPGSFKQSRLPLQARAGEHELSVTALCRYSHTGEGLHRFTDPADGRVYLYTQFETADARRMYACFEQPDLKATFQLTVRAPQGWAVVSNSLTPEPSAPDAAGSQVWTFAATPRIATYITALIAGEFQVEPGTITTAKGEIPAALVCRQSMRRYLDSDRIRTTTQHGFDVYEEDFGRAYPFDKYDQLFVPEFNAGAMENAGAVTIRDEYLFRSKVTSAQYEARDNTIVHELAHMWFGDLVTMRWWDDLWLNESFAEWCAYHCQQRVAERLGGIDPWVSFAGGRKGWAYTQDQLPTTHPIAADMVDLEAVEQNFDGITYAKGASVLKQLVAYVGEEQFLAGVREYLDDHALGNAEFADLLAALQKASGRDLSDFAEQWLTTSGVNTLRADVAIDAADRYTRFEIVQTAPTEHPTLRTHHIAVGLYEPEGERLLRSESLELDVSGERTAVPALIGRKRVALALINDQDLGFAKIRLDPDSLTTARERIGAIDDPLARSLIWGMAWDMVYDAELPAADYIALVTRGIGAETDMTAVRTQLRQVRFAASAYTAPAEREAAAAALFAGLSRQLDAAAPGSERQLPMADALIAAAFDERSAGLLARWLAGEQLPEGLVIDQDRRWAIVTTLARLGRAGEAEIVAEAERDRTISGAELAAGARAALADPAAKAAAWQLATEDPDVPNGTHAHICMDFFNYGQEPLLEPYVDRYLQVCELISAKQGIWATRGHAVSETVLAWLWPMPLADRAFIRRLDAWQSAGQLSDSVRHTLSERRHATLRALAAQELGATAAGATATA
jgi:aminopeptidase N